MTGCGRCPAAWCGGPALRRRSSTTRPSCCSTSPPRASILTSGWAFRALLREFAVDTWVGATHLVEDVAAACSDVVLVDAGRLVFQGLPADLAAAGADVGAAGADLAADSPAERGYSAILRQHREQTGARP
jgi:hypothetical protein